MTGVIAQQFALGETVKATVAARQTEVLSVPRAAVLYDGNQPYVFLVEDGHVRRQDVTLAQAEGESVWVEDGLKADQRVAISNLIGLRDGAAVSATSP